MFKSCVVAALLVLATQAGVVQASAIPAYPFVHTGGSGYIFAAPDRGEIDFELRATDADPALAQRLLEERATQLRTLIEQQGADVAEIEVRDVRNRMREDAKADPAVPLYDLTIAVHIEVKDLSKWSTLLKPMLDMQNIHQLSTSFSTSERDKIEAQLTIEALKDARRKADIMARGVGKTVVGATAVSSGPLKNLTGAVGLQTSNSGTNTDPAGRNTPGTRDDLLTVVTLRLTQSVDVIFKIK